MTDTALVVREDFKVTAEDVKKYFAPNATDKEFGILMGICKSFGLNPFKREVHFVKYGNNPASIITGYEIYLKRAERTGRLDGWKCWIEKDDLGEKAIIEIKRKDQSQPIHWEVYRKEFDKQQSTWKAMPSFMLKKVAIAQGFRLAFPDDLGGLPYIPEEMPHEKGGGTSESLPEAPIIEAEPTELEDALPTGTELRTKVDGLIESAGIDKKEFKQWLAEKGKIGKKFGNPSLSTMSVENANKMVAAWDKTLEAFTLWVDKKNA